MEKIQYFGERMLNSDGSHASHSDDVAKRLSVGGSDVSRRALEALALQGYGERTLTLFQVSEMLGFSRVETEDFLGQHLVPLSEISEADLDRQAALFEAAARRPR